MLAIEDKKEDPKPKRTALDGEALRRKELDDEMAKIERQTVTPEEEKQIGKAKPTKAPERKSKVQPKGTEGSKVGKKIKGKDPEGHEKTIAVKKPKPLAVKKKPAQPAINPGFTPFSGKPRRLFDDVPEPLKKGVKQSAAFQKKKGRVSSVSLVPV